MIKKNLVANATRSGRKPSKMLQQFINKFAGNPFPHNINLLIYLQACIHTCCPICFIIILKSNIMKPYTKFLLMVALFASPFFSSQVNAQLPVDGNATVPTCNNPVFSENFVNERLENSGSDLYNGLPRNGSWQIVSSVNQLGGGGYLPVKAPGGGNFLAAHTSNTITDRVWFAQVPVQPGMTYNFCASVALLKNLGKGAVYLLGVYANGKEIGTGRVNFEWSQVCGSYTVPQDVTSIEFSIRDPKKGLFFVAIGNICVSPLRPMADRSVNKPIPVSNKLSVFPNPATSTPMLRYISTVSDDAIIRVYNNNGIILQEQKRKLLAGTNDIKLYELNKANSGTYLVQVIVGGKVTSQKLLLTK